MYSSAGKLFVFYIHRRIVTSSITFLWMDNPVSSCSSLRTGTSMCSKWRIYSIWWAQIDVGLSPTWTSHCTGNLIMCRNKSSHLISWNEAKSRGQQRTLKMMLIRKQRSVWSVLRQRCMLCISCTGNTQPNLILINFYFNNLINS